MALALEPLKELANRHQLAFIAMFGSTARQGQGRDLDLALMPRDPLALRPDLLALCADLGQEVQRNDLDLVWLPDASWLLAWHVARDGRLLFESRSGRFREFQGAAWCRQADSHSWRRWGRAYLDGFLKGGPHRDRDLVRQKLLAMSRYLAELELVLSHPREEFLANPLLHRTAERSLELLVECAVRINTEVGRSKGVPPSDYSARSLP